MNSDVLELRQCIQARHGSAAFERSWDEGEFVDLAEHVLELVDGRLELLGPQNWFESLISSHILRSFQAFLDRDDPGLVAMGLLIRLWSNEIRQPDIVFCFHEHIRDRKKVQNGADLVIEVVS